MIRIPQPDYHLVLLQAILIAHKAHKGQKDKADVDYIHHPTAVMHNVLGEHTKVLAVLHDVLEDSDLTSEMLFKEGIPTNIIDELIILTRSKDQTYNEYINKIADSNNHYIIRVKLEDLKHNMDFTRLKKITDKDISRVKKYHKAYLKLTKTLMELS